LIIYEVTAVVEARLAEAYERYVRQQHIADVLTPGRYRVRYEASAQQWAG
jgi:hypothetical protein